MSPMIISLIIVLVLLLLVFGFTTMWRRVPQDKALVITGLKKRVISGGGGFVIPLLERADRISLENMTIDVDISNVLTEQGVEISVDGVAVIKVKSDETSVLAAMEQFNTGEENKTFENIRGQAKNVLEGKLREIISKLTVEETYKDRDKFSSHVQEVAGVDLQKMGLEIKAFTIRNIGDRNGYLEALGKPKIAAVKRDAEIAQAEAARETKIKTAEAMRLGEAARLLAETQVAEAARDKEIKVQSFNKDQMAAKADADLSYDKRKFVVEQEVQAGAMQVEIIKKQKEIELAEQEALRKERELEATVKKQADATKYSAEKTAEAKKYTEIQNAEAEAQAIKLRALAESEAIKLKGQAEAEAIKAKGTAEAEAMMKKAEAYKQYNDAAMAQMVIEKLPDLAKAITEPLAKTEKIVMIGDSGASKLTKDITNIIAQLPENVEALTGFNLKKLFEKNEQISEGIKKS
jgi:flotillin